MVPKMSRALDGVRIRKNQVHGNVLGASLLKKRKSVEIDRGNLVRNGLRVPVEQLAEAVEKPEAALTLEKLFGGVLAGLRGGAGLASFKKCVRGSTFVDEVRVFGGDVRIVFVKVRSISWGY